MKRFLKRGIIYSVPLLLVVFAVYVVDPYYLFTKKKSYNEEKFKIGYSFDQGRRYKIFTYWNEPTDKILLGASEINVITEHNIPEKGWHSLSFGGAPLQESLQLYWEVSREHKLSKVIIAPEFIKYYNAISSGDGDPYYANFMFATSQSATAFNIYNNKLDYFIDKYTLKTTWQYLLFKVSGNSLQSVPKISKAEFWRSQMDYAHKIYEGNVVINSKIPEIVRLFELIKKDAELNRTKVIIVIPVQHLELLKTEFQKGVYDIYKEYIRMLVRTFGEVHYFAYTEGISEDAEAFSDPFHYLSASIYIDNLFGSVDSHILKSNNVDIKLNQIKQRLYPNE
jgi:hypothetical protein